MNGEGEVAFAEARPGWEPRAKVADYFGGPLLATLRATHGLRPALLCFSCSSIDAGLA